MRYGSIGREISSRMLEITKQSINVRLLLLYLKSVGSPSYSLIPAIYLKESLPCNVVLVY